MVLEHDRARRGVWGPRDVSIAPGISISSWILTLLVDVCEANTRPVGVCSRKSGLTLEALQRLATLGSMRMR